jgi:tryptophan synthase alpha chain
MNNIAKIDTMNRIDELFRNKKKEILSVYFTAGYPLRNSTTEIIRELVSGGVDIIEIGVPFSDPMADGPIIQHSNSTALKNGMNLKVLFRQLRNIRKDVDIPLIIMSYINPLLSFGMRDFCRTCEETGIDGVIIPDLPPEIYIEEYKSFFRLHGLKNIMMISPQTQNKRIREIDRLSTGFIYMVSSSSTTGIKKGFSKEQIEYFDRVKKMKLKNPVLIGFGISSPETFDIACSYSEGAIIGSAFVKMIREDGAGKNYVRNFTNNIKKNMYK